MIFSSPLFLFLFFPVVVAGYYASFLIDGGKGSSQQNDIQRNNILRNIILLIASIFFYAWGEPLYVFLILFSIVVNHCFGKLIQSRIDKDSAGFQQLFFGVIFNLLLLAIFKYLDFFIEGVNLFFNISLIPTQQLSLPLGISFYTFQAISFLVDIHRKEAKAPKNVLNTALYISFFPQLIAGPIVRFRDISKELLFREHSVERCYYGVSRFIIGLGKKVLLANTLGEYVDYMYSLPAENLTIGLTWLAVVSYALQIYYDFSGYSDMAIGLGAIFGFTFPENFNYPYAAKSVKEFWRRWHITLSTWFRDYLYIPLGGSRSGLPRTYRNLFLVFFLCGLWHGAAWNFVFWGMLHGIFLMLERGWFGRFLAKTPFFGRVYLLLVVTLSWIPFRAESFEQTQVIVRTLLGLNVGIFDRRLIFYLTNELILVFIAGVFLAFPFFNFYKKKEKEEEEEKVWIHVFSLVCIFILCAMKLASGTYNPFIYFRF